MIAGRLDRYIFRQLLLGLILVASGLAALVWVTQSLRYIELVLDRGLSLLVFVELTGLLLPSFFAVILPITTFVVVLFVYVRLAADRELTVMRAAGLSHWQLARPALALGLLATVLGHGLTLWLVPLSQSAFRDWQFEIRDRMAGLLLQEGVFSTVGGVITIYARSRDRDGTLRGILVHDARDPRQPATILAEAGRFSVGPAGPRVALVNGQRQVLEQVGGQLRLSVLSFAENTLELALITRGEQLRNRTPQERGLAELLDPPEGTSPRDRLRFAVEAHQRLAGPLSALSLALVALAVALTGEFRRHSGGGRIAIGALLATGLVAAGMFAASAAARNGALLPLIWLHALAPGAAAAWILQGGAGLPRRLRPS
ncbi:MAG: LPS export ABC transporter permease LptF [Rhodovarius sp.]|nr:LPS export ABC transporter permease LptF [Rhodovarius sp.]MCX7933537.1 LPS export ABC transporter permease LptF [Rhodovarius sp.]MDW8313689.1 LPS export ABC transporter permease LptF [Rhodovarius sp.]